MYSAFQWLARIGTVLAFGVVVVGAWVRLSDAGLGCPDWPGCYGRAFVTAELQADASLGAEYGRPVEVHKAWREMFHRYLASSLGLVCVALAGLALANRRDPRQPWRVPLALVGLVIFQGLLGMWTVTLQLTPLIVVAHLFGGLATLSLLFWLARPRPEPLAVGTGLKALAVAATAALVLQIALGGWTSSNYAAVACPDFPKCQTQWWPQIADFKDAFVLWRGVGIDYSGGVLDHPARVAIHFTHRLGAVVAAVLLLSLAGALAFRGRAALRTGALIAAAAAVQVTLGASMVVLGIPLAAAVAHNGVAALLLLSVVNAHKRIW
ncbi:MAG TPA: COX15/CtaA family protein [Gammaproteobacteria bacterium]|nr:COX15/CtaA family protein [Gammaproteobacteria bacterium]